MKKLSIGVRLTLWYLVLFAAAQLVFGTGMWFFARRSLYRITDDALQGQIDDLTNFLDAQKKNATVAKLQEEVAEAYLLEHSGDYLQIYDDSDGDWIFRADVLRQHALPPLAPDLMTQPLHHDEQLGRSVRFVSQRIKANGRVFRVQMGLPIDQVNQTLVLFRGYLLDVCPSVAVRSCLRRVLAKPKGFIAGGRHHANSTNHQCHESERPT